MISAVLDIQSELDIFIEKERIFHELVIIITEKIFKSNGLDLTDVYPYFKKNNLFEKNINVSEYIRHDIKTTQNYAKLFSETFIQFFSKDEQKDIGIFLTNNNNLIQCLFDNICLDYENLENSKILEPAVGAGAFIIPILKNIVNSTMSKTINEIKDVIYSVSKNFCCVDINPLCTHITELLLVLELIPLCKIIKKMEINYILPKLRVITGDYLSVANTLENTFDYVIGNPPYVTMYGRRSRGMTEEKRKYFNETFDFVLKKKGNNKFNLCMFFIELSLKNLRSGGKLSFILDISFFETAYTDLRKYILENSKICSVDLRNTGFENVASGQFILTIEKENLFSKCQENKIKWYIEDNVKIQNQYELYNEKNKYKYFAPIDPEAKEFLQLFTELKTLRSLCPNKELRTCCALTGKTEYFLVDKKYISDCKVAPYLEGSKGIERKFDKPKATKIIKLDYDLQIQLSNEFKVELEKQGVKNKKRVTLGNIDGYFYPKLFIRQSATELIATYTEEPFAANNSLYILTFLSEEKSKKNLLKYLCGLINSEILSYYAVKTGIIRIGQGKTPQIKISDLLNLPIIISEQYFSKVVSIVDERLNAVDNKCKIYLDNELNSVVAKIYNK